MYYTLTWHGRFHGAPYKCARTDPAERNGVCLRVHYLARRPRVPSTPTDYLAAPSAAAAVLVLPARV